MKARGLLEPCSSQSLGSNIFHRFGVRMESDLGQGRFHGSPKQRGKCPFSQNRPSELFYFSEKSVCELGNFLDLGRTKTRVF